MNPRLRHYAKAVARRLARGSGRPGRGGTWDGYTYDALQLADVVDCTREDIAAAQQHPERVHPDPRQRACNWYLPPFDNPFYGGMMTILRFAAFMQRQGVRQRLLICGSADVKATHEQVCRAFPELESCAVVALDSASALASIPAADYSIATLWTTAYVLLRVSNTGLKFYFIQDFEPLFYPAGSTSAQAELSYRFGFYGLANTRSIGEIYEREFSGVSHHIEPCVDERVFHDNGAPRAASPLRLFYYARPGIPRNGFELAAAALKRVKAHLGERVDIVCAGADWSPTDYGLQNVIRAVGLLPYAETGALYRTCHAGLALMMTRHPSYLPFELMACGCTVVANHNPANEWLLRDGETALLAPASATGLAQTLIEALEAWNEHAALRRRAAALIRARHSDWERELAATYRFVLAPDRNAPPGPTPDAAISASRIPCDEE